MPRGDRTGPSGEGPSTGKGMGYCSGNDHPGFNDPRSIPGNAYGRRFRGRGYGWGGGFGFRHGYGNFNQGNVTDVSEKTLIENEIRILKEQLSGLEDRLANIEEK